MRMTIGKKLGWGFGALVTIIVLFGGYNIWTMKRVNEASTVIEKYWMPSAQYLAAVNRLNSDFRIIQFAHAIETDPAKMKQYKEAMQKIAGQIKENEKKYEPLISSEKERTVYESYKKGWKEYLKIHEEQFLPLSRALNDEDSYKVLMGNEALFVKISKYLHEGVAINCQGGIDASQAGDRIYKQTVMATIVLLILIFILAVMLAIIITRAIANPVRVLRDAAAKIGEGKLDTRVVIKSKDEIGFLAASFNEMAKNLKDSQERIQAQNEELNANNEELRTINEELESTNEELKQANEELESTTEELRVANEEAQKAKEAAEKKAEDLERFNKMAVDRELKMRELKERIAELEAKLKVEGN